MTTQSDMLCKQCGSVLSAVTLTCVRGEYCKPENVDEIKQAEEPTAVETLLDALNSIATETCDHGPGLCPREIATQALADYGRRSNTVGLERIRVIVRPGKDDWIGVAYSSHVEPNDVIREYVRSDVSSEREERLEFAADVSRNQQYRINELERIVGLLLRYVDHQRGCTSYTNGPCTCGLENTVNF